MTSLVQTQIDAIVARLKVLEDKAGITLPSADLAPESPRILNIPRGWVTPSTEFGANVRIEPNTKATKMYLLAPGDSRQAVSSVAMLNLSDGSKYVWHELADGYYVRADVVIFSQEKP